MLYMSKVYKKESKERYTCDENYYLVQNVRDHLSRLSIPIKTFLEIIGKNPSYFRGLRGKKKVVHQNDMNKVINFFKEKGCNISHDELVNNYLISN